MVSTLTKEPPMKLAGDVKDIKLAGEGQKDEAAGIRVAARLLRVRAIQERAEAAACWADAVSRACAPCRTSGSKARA